jgi:hypothetical protein
LQRFPIQLTADARLKFFYQLLAVSSAVAQGRKLSRHADNVAFKLRFDKRLQTRTIFTQSVNRVLYSS